MSEQAKQPHIWYQAITRLYASILDEKVAGLDYLKPVRELVDNAVVSGLERTLTPDFYRGLVKTAMQEAGYPSPLSDEISDAVAKAIEENFPNQMLFFRESARPYKPSKDELVGLLEDCRGNISQASRALKVNRVTMYSWLADYDIDLDAIRTEKPRRKR